MKTYKKVIAYLGPMKWMLFGGALCSALSVLFTLYGYRLLNLFFRDLIIKADGSSARQYAWRIAASLALGFAVYFLSTFVTHVAAFRLETVLRKKGVVGLSQASQVFFDRNPSGRVRKIIDDNAAQTHMAVAHLVPDIAIGAIMPIGIIVLAYMADWKAGIVVSVLTVLSLIALHLMMGNKEFLKTYQAYLEKLGSASVEYVRGMQVVKVFGTGIESFTDFYRCIMDYARFALKYSMSCKWPYVLFQLLFLGLMTVVIPIWIYAGNFGDSPEKAVVILLMLAFLTGVFFVTFMKIMYLGMHIQLADMAMEKLETLYAEMADSQMVFGTETVFTNSDIAFHHVDFGYGDNQVLKDFSLTLKENHVYAFVGGSGSGKSTVAKLVSGFYRADKGEITIGGKDIFAYEEKALMKKIAVVFQNPQLFKKSLYDNVLIGNPSASREQVLEAMTLAGCQDIIEKFPERENTIIGSQGVYLSGGEKQRITIARAILKDADIIILDEASGAVDPENEYAFQKAFSNLIRGKTVIMIAHRLSSIRGASKIFVMQDGRIIEEGSDAHLMQKDTRYRYYQELYNKTNDWRVVSE